VLIRKSLEPSDPRQRRSRLRFRRASGLLISVASEATKTAIKSVEQFGLSISRFFRWRSLWTVALALIRRSANYKANPQEFSRELDLEWRIINLAARMDRLLEANTHFEDQGIRWSKFVAIAHSNGALGCAYSHISLLTSLSHSEDIGAVAVAEDDLQFLASKAEVDEIIKEFLMNPYLDVLCLSHRTRGLRIPISKNLSVANQVFTTSAYIVKSHAIKTLVSAFERSASQLKLGADKRIAAIDVCWQDEQLRSLAFAIPRRVVARQRASYSDVAKKFADYRF